MRRAIGVREEGGRGKVGICKRKCEKRKGKKEEKDTEIQEE